MLIQPIAHEPGQASFLESVDVKGQVHIKKVVMKRLEEHLFWIETNSQPSLKYMETELCHQL